MSYKLEVTHRFDKEVKRLAKKYPSLLKDLLELRNELSHDPFCGTPIGNNCYKIRLAITSKGKGKSGGARIITNIVIQQKTVYLLSIYDKSEQSTISDKDIFNLLKQLPK